MDPLSGTRVLDLSRVWAGPLATKFLADSGAEVIKVQAVRHFALDRLDNASGYWHQCNANKLAICIELAHPEGVALFKRLVVVSDVVLENFTPRVMRRFGLDYEALRRANPELIMIACPAMGSTGPEADYAALGESIEALAGIVAQTGYHDEDQPIKTGINYADPIVGMQAAAAVLAALIHRRRGGGGQFIDLSMREATVTLIGEQVVAHAATGRVPERTGNRDPVFAPQGAYRCRSGGTGGGAPDRRGLGNRPGSPSQERTGGGAPDRRGLGNRSGSPSENDDQWLTISVRSDDEWRRLCAAIGRPGLANDPRYADAASRRAEHDALDAIIDEWASEQDAREATALLQAAGIAAAPVSYVSELLSDPHLTARGFWAAVDQPGFGVKPYPTLPYRLSRAPVEISAPPPAFAQHNREIFCNLLGLSDAEFVRLEAARVISPEPLPYRSSDAAAG